MTDFPFSITNRLFHDFFFKCNKYQKEVLSKRGLGTYTSQPCCSSFSFSLLVPALLTFLVVFGRKGGGRI